MSLYGIVQPQSHCTLFIRQTDSCSLLLRQALNSSSHLLEHAICFGLSSIISPHIEFAFICPWLAKIKTGVCDLKIQLLQFKG